MGQIHQLLETQGKQAAIDSSAASRDVIEAAALYLSDEDNALTFAYSGRAECALPHRRIPADQTWEVASDRIRLVVEPGRRPTGPDGQGPMAFVGVPFGAYARLILLYLQTEALRTGSRDVELGRSWRDWVERIGIPWGGRSGRGGGGEGGVFGPWRATFPPSRGGGGHWRFNARIFVK